MRRNKLFKQKIAPIVLYIINDLITKDHHQAYIHCNQLKDTYGKPFLTEILEGVIITIDELRAQEKECRNQPLRFSLRKTLKENVLLMELENKIQKYQSLQRIMIDTMSDGYNEVMLIDL